MVARCVAAVLGGYGCTQVASIVVAHLVPGSRADGVLVATMTSFLVYTGAITWSFAAASTRRAWIGLLVPTVLLALPAWWIASGGGGP